MKPKFTNGRLNRVSLLMGWGIWGAVGCGQSADTPDANEQESLQLGRHSQALTKACSLLDDPSKRRRMSGAFEISLLRRCGLASAPPRRLRSAIPSRSAPLTNALGGNDILLNNPALDIGGTTQSETTVAVHGNVVCVAWNDSGEDFFINGGSGFGYSLDGGQTFTDGGPFPSVAGDSSGGDPSLFYSERDGAFYYAALSELGLSMWKSTSDCQTFQYVGAIHQGFGDDKELLAIDNSPGSPNFGRIYVGWTDFNLFPDSNVVSFSDDSALSWSFPAQLPNSGGTGQGMWPAIAPNGDAYFALVNRGLELGGFQDQWIYKAVELDGFPEPNPTMGGAGGMPGGGGGLPGIAGSGGFAIAALFDAGAPIAGSFDAGLPEPGPTGPLGWERLTDIGTAQLIPESEQASVSCGRQALNGDIRYLSSPQIAIHPDPTAFAGYVIHTTYSYDSDGSGPDNSNVFYRNSEDGALSWSDEVKLNDDNTDTDQFIPALAVQLDGVVVVSWYDRRLDPINNLLFDRFLTYSPDGGQTWTVNERVSDVSSPVAQTNPNFDNLATCYHGDYDQVAVQDGVAHIVWSDDRRITGTGPNPDVYYDQVVVNPQKGIVRLQPNYLNCSSSVTVSLRDKDLEGQGTTTLSLTSNAGDIESVLLLEDSTQLGHFSGSIATGEGTVVPANGQLQVSDGDSINVQYLDADTGEGERGLATADAPVDCLAPEVLNIQTRVSGTTATLNVDVSEAASLLVQYGFACDTLTQSATGHTSGMNLNSLTAATRYFFTVTATDRADNSAINDNNGQCFSFQTPAQVYSEDFEGGLGEFTIDNSTGAGNGLWHLSNRCAAEDYGHTRPTALYYGQDATCTFDNGLVNEGVVTSPVIALGSTNGASLEFRYFLGTEGGGFYDQAAMSVSVNGDPFEVVDSNFSSLNVPSPSPIKIRSREGAVSAVGEAFVSDEGSWETSTVDLSELLKGLDTADIQLQLSFNSLDDGANNFAGFYVDDIRVFAIDSPQVCDSTSDCDDGLVCNGEESCQQGVCVAGRPVVCQPNEDGISCTEAVCREDAKGCIIVANDELCTDNLFCNGLEICNPTIGCEAGPEPICESQFECAEPSCSELLKGCGGELLHFLCDDEVACNGQEQCDPTVGCVPGPDPCDDGILCTEDSCAEDLLFPLCSNIPVNAVCDDGLFCNGEELCQTGLGCLVGDEPCIDGNCNEQKNSCTIACVVAQNDEHVILGRAHFVDEVVYLALGSDDFMGTDGETTTSLQGGDNIWELVSACPAAPEIDTLDVQVIGNVVLIEGTASDPNGDLASVIVTFDQFGIPFTAEATGTDSFSFVAPELESGFYSVSARAVDDAGQSSASTTTSFVVLPPQAPTVDSIAVVKGEKGELRVTGTASDINDDLAAVTVLVRRANTIVATFDSYSFDPWSVVVSGIAPGSYTVQAQATDAYGLIGQASEALPLMVPNVDADLECFETTNGLHREAERARAVLGNLFFLAYGSNDFMGIDSEAVTALQGSGSIWEMVDNCSSTVLATASN